MTIRQDKRRHILRVTDGPMPSVVNQINRALVNLDERINQVDAVGQNPDAKGKTIKNLGNLRNVQRLDATASLTDVINKINEIIVAFDGGG